MFNENRLKMKTASPIYIIKNKKQCCQLLLDRACILVLCPLFLRARLGAQVNLHAQKIGCNEGNLSRPLNNPTQTATRKCYTMLPKCYTFGQDLFLSFSGFVVVWNIKESLLGANFCISMKLECYSAYPPNFE